MQHSRLDLSLTKFNITGDRVRGLHKKARNSDHMSGLKITLDNRRHTKKGEAYCKCDIDGQKHMCIKRKNIFDYLPHQ